MLTDQQKFLLMKDIRREYGESPNKVVAVDGVDFTVSTGELFAIMGPSDLITAIRIEPNQWTISWLAGIVSLSA